MRYSLSDRKVKIIIYLVVLFSLQGLYAQQYTALKVPDTGQTSDYSSVFGEDSDYLINAPSFTDNGDGTVTDNITGLIWQKVDGGEMSFENARTYCENLILGGYSDWRLPDHKEIFSILNHGKSHPALDSVYFTRTLAEYWWSKDAQVDDASKIWVVNAGGGIGAHPKTETISTGGTKRFHVRAVRSSSLNFINNRFQDNNDGSVTDLVTGLIWQKDISPVSLPFENALICSENLSLSGHSDWRLPNIKELQSLNDVLRKNPSIDSAYFKNVPLQNVWSSTTLIGQPVKAWYMNLAYGTVGYTDKTQLCNIICVRGVSSYLLTTPEMTLIAGGDFIMGDHYGYIDPQHPSDETPLHLVNVDSFYIGTFELTNQQYCDFLNSAKSQGLIEVRNNLVYAVGDTNVYCFTKQYVSYSSISWSGSNFSVSDFRTNHPLIGVMWCGAAAYCNWLSQQTGLSATYNIPTWNCDFAKTGFRLPTEAEWEFAARGGEYNPYYIFPWGNDSMNLSLANWPSSGDPFEIGDYPWTTPVGFYNGDLRFKQDYNWPGSGTSYQTSDGSNPYGLYDISGNVWEFVNDWYLQNYYSISPYDNPKGPLTGSVMPDGKIYRGMRGGNWYNGQWGHSRVANRNPSYYRGPQDPNHPWYHIGFRIARKYSAPTTGVSETGDEVPEGFKLYQNYPNPFNPSTKIAFSLSHEAYVTLKIFNALGEEIKTLFDQAAERGNYEVDFKSDQLSSGILFCRFQADDFVSVKKMILLK